MRYVSIRNQTKVLQKSIRARYCDTFFCKLRGLTFRMSLPEDEGLVLVMPRDSKVDSSIHMLFVWMNLGVIWINADGMVVDKKLAKSWHLAYIPDEPAKYVLELNPKRLEEFNIGDQIDFEERNPD